MAAPSGLVTTEIRQQIEGQIKYEADLRKDYNAGVAHTGTELLNERRYAEAQDRNGIISRENQHLDAIQNDLKAERQQRLSDKHAFREEAVSAINHKEEDKRNAWNSLHKDHANQ